MNIPIGNKIENRKPIVSKAITKKVTSKTNYWTRRDLNPGPPPREGGALPLSYEPLSELPPPLKAKLPAFSWGFCLQPHLPVQKPSSPIPQISLTCGLCLCMFGHSIQTFYLFKLFYHPALKGEVFGYKIILVFLNFRLFQR